MARMSRLKRSNAVHSRLRKKARNILGKDRFAAKKWTYHDRVERIQNAKNRVLTKAERRKIYQSS